MAARKKDAGALQGARVFVVGQGRGLGVVREVNKARMFGPTQHTVKFDR